MSHLIPQLKNTIAGAIAQDLPDFEIRKLIMAIVDDDKVELTTIEAAEYLKKSVATLKRWRRDRIPLRYRKDPGGAIRYRLDWLREFQSEGVIEG
jgi:hypothetical protein